MKYDFESLIERHGMDAMAVDAVGIFPEMAPSRPREGFDEIPMWVADMNFPTSKSVQDAIINRAKHPCFGYFFPQDNYYDAISRWHQTHKHVDDVTKEVIGYENGVLGGVCSALRVLAQPGDSILLHSPTYVGFREEVMNANGYHIVESPLVRDSGGVWRMDYDDMDRKLKKYHIHTAIFCNPYNPCGRVWTKEEIRSAMEVYERNECFVISDEIWSDLMMNGHLFTAAQSVSPWAKTHTAAFYSPSKTFNLSGLIGSYSVIYDRLLRERIQGASAKLVYNMPNVLSIHALIGAYSEEGSDWLSQLLPVLSENVNFAYEYVKAEFKGVSVFRTEGTYMMLLDLAGWLKDHGKTQQEVLRLGWEYGIGWQDGTMFGAPEMIRINLASPHSRIKEAFRRMDQYVFNR